MSRSLKADQVAAAFISSPGSYAEIYRDAVTSAQTLSSATWADVPTMDELTFEVAFGGAQRLDANLALFTGTAVDSYVAAFRIVIDAGGYGGFSEQTVGGTDDWQVRVDRLSTENEYDRVFASAPVTLEAGTHKLKFQYQRISTESPRLGTDQPLVAHLQGITGSGAGGDIIDEFILDQSFDSTSATWEEVTDSGTNPVEVTATVAGPNDRVTLLGAICWSIQTSDAVGHIGIGIDGADPVSPNAYQVGTLTAGGLPIGSIGVSLKMPALSAGTHTFTLMVKRIVGTGTVRVASAGGAERATLLQAVLVRGGLVPIKQDGTLVQDKPQAINLLGPGLQATNVGGQVNVSVQSAAEGVEVVADGLAAAFDIDNAAFEDTGLAVDIDVVEGEFVIIALSGVAYTVGTAGLVNFRATSSIDGTLIEAPPMNTGSTTYAHQNVSWSVPVGPLSAGTHTINLQAKFTTGSGNRLDSKSVFKVTRMRGGYVQPENIPILAYSSASVVNCVKRPGASDRFWLVLSDGKRYYADGTQTIDLTTSGLGGLDTGTEATSTWYYCYAVPTSSTSSVFGVVASVTDPDSGGPTGYSAWRWLGAIRNDSSGNIVRFTQVGDWFYMYPWGTENNLINISGASPTFNSWVNVSTGLAASAPVAVADAVQVRGWTDGDSGQLFRMWLEPGNPPYWSPTGGQVEYAASSFLAVQENVQANNTRIVEIPDGTMSYYFQTYGGSTALDCNIKVTAWRASRLFGTQTQTQAQYQPDTKRIVLTWTSATQVVASPRNGNSMRVTLQDGKQRTSSTALSFNPSLGATDGGLDTGTEAANTWYYVYLVPKSGDDNSLAVRGSINYPGTGPTGYSNYWYVGPVRNDGSSNFVEFLQVGFDRFRFREQQIVYANTAPPTSWTALDMSSFLPATCQVARMTVEIIYTNSGSGGGETLELRRTGDTNTSRSLVWDGQPSSVHGNSSETDIEVNGSRSLDHQWTRNETFAVCTYYLNEFTDSYAGEATQ